MKNKRVVVAWIALIAWMLLIFYMSQQNGEVSSKQSDLVIKIFAAIGINLNNSLGELATFLVRKAAHFSEYLILYFLAINVLKHYYKISKAMLYSVAFVFFYACTDEIHQYFIPGRTCALKDVLIDSAGGAFGYLINKIYLLKKK